MSDEESDFSDDLPAEKEPEVVEKKEEEPKEESNGTQTDSLYELDLSNSQQTMDDVTVFEPIRDSIPNLPP